MQKVPLPIYEYHQSFGQDIILSLRLIRFLQYSASFHVLVYAGFQAVCKQQNSSTLTSIRPLLLPLHFQISGYTLAVFLTCAEVLQENLYFYRLYVSEFQSADIQNNQKASDYSLLLFLQCYR